jgi:hypothetical protein
MRKCKHKCGAMVVLAILGVAALSYVVMMLWNWLIPVLFVGGKAIGYWQAMGILVLSKILFGGFKGGCCRHKFHRGCTTEQMSSEEEEKVRCGLLNCCSGKEDKQ